MWFDLCSRENHDVLSKYPFILIRRLGTEELRHGCTCKASEDLCDHHKILNFNTLYTVQFETCHQFTNSHNKLLFIYP